MRPDGSAPAAPLADADVQAVAYAALRAIARCGGGVDARAEALAARLERDFGPDVMALEADDAPVPGAGSQLGWLLWSGALGRGARRGGRRAPERARRPHRRTACARSRGRARCSIPQGYHRGSIWPFDSWLGWGGLRAAGFLEEAERVRSGVLAALDRLGQAPELYAVDADGELQPGAGRQPRAGVDAWARAGRSSTAGTAAARRSSAAASGLPARRRTRRARPPSAR